MLKIALLTLVFAFPLYADIRVANSYVSWAETAISEDRWNDALLALERANDFSDVSSDVSYLLALARFNQNRDRALVLRALNQGLALNRWNKYSALDARTLRAETLIQIRRYNEAIAELSALPQNVNVLSLQLLALRGLDNREYFAQALEQIMNRYPGSARPVRIFF
jgi:hypothetical protein